MAVPYFAYGAIGLTGGASGNLDTISSAYLSENDIAFAVHNEKVYFYKIDMNAGGDTNSPYLIKPINATDDRRWVLISQEMYTTNIIQQLENYIQTSEIRAISGEDIVITTGDGEEIFINSDGTVEFPSTVSGEDPVSDQDFITKQYLTALIEDTSNLEMMLEFEVINWTQSGSLYYSEVIHDKDTENLLINCWKGNELAQPEKIEIIDSNTIKIWMTTNEILTVLLI